MQERRVSATIVQDAAGWSGRIDGSAVKVRARRITYLDRGTFPAPAATLASGRVWRRDDVERFAADRRRRAKRRAAR